MIIICIMIWGILGMFFTNNEVQIIPDPEGYATKNETIMLDS